MENIQIHVKNAKVFKEACVDYDRQIYIIELRKEKLYDALNGNKRLATKKTDYSYFCRKIFPREGVISLKFPRAYSSLWIANAKHMNVDVGCSRVERANRNKTEISDL